jgi:predicted ATP-grasp superfamily ATP-dependent carboligase
MMTGKSRGLRRFGADPRGSVTLDTGTPALVLRLERNIFHHGTLGVIRSLGRAGVEVHAVLEGQHTPASRSRYLHRMHPWRPEMLDPEALLGNLRDISESIGRRAVLVPVDDASSIFIAENAAELADRFLLPAQEPDLPRRVADKAALVEICRELDMPHPETYVPNSFDEVRQAVHQLGLPLVAKWSRPWLSIPSPTALVNSLDEVLELFALTPMAGGPLTLQRRLPPGRGVDWFFHGYFDFSSSCLLGAVGRKERSYPLQTGLTTLGSWQINPRLESMARRFACKLGYSGILDFDFRYDPTSRVYYLLDFNPRLGAQFRLFTDGQGLDLIRTLHLDLTGHAVPKVRPQYNRVFLAENYDLVSAALHLWNRNLTVSAWLRSVRGVDELAWFASDDLRPYLTVVPRWLGFCVQRLRRGPSRPAKAGAQPHIDR